MTKRDAKGQPEKEAAEESASETMAEVTIELINAKLDLVSALMRLDELGVDVSRIDLAVVLDFGRKLHTF